MVVLVCRNKMSKLKIALLTDSNQLQAWQWDCLADLINQNKSEIVLEIRNQNPGVSPKSSHYFYRLYRALDRRFFGRKPDAFIPKAIESLPIPPIPVLPVSPIRSKYRDEFSTADIEKIKSHNPDLILRFGFRILTGEILSLARLGVWSYHHGDPSVYRGGPPAFWEVMKNLPLTGTVLMRLSEKLDEGAVLYRSQSQTDPLSVQRNANRIFRKSSFFVARVINQLESLSEDQWACEIQEQSPTSVAPLWKPPGNLEMLNLLSRLLLRNFLRKKNERKHPAHWKIGFTAFTSMADLVQNGFTAPINVLPESNGNSYFADPFPFSHLDKEFLLVEEFDNLKQKGSISLLDVATGQSKKIIEEAYHLSYPFLFESKGNHYLIPESGDEGKLWIYKASQFPEQWIKAEVFHPRGGYDPSLFFYEGIYWLFVTEKAHPDCSPFEELSLYWKGNLDDEDWTPHPQNPIVSDVSCARSAGKVFEENGRLYRPAQDSGLRYGYQIKIQEILILSKTQYLERTIYTIGPELIPGALGVHTFNRLGSKVYLDFYFRQ